ncbi:hypothetical protein ACMGE5_10195 [Macrococcus equi]|uniref:hypothetical protein n=1 Tax=Macrococcus equi TaxID=3395462 RepID=UPI0039BE2661
MSKIAEKKQRIEEIKAKIYEFMDTRTKLEKEVKDLDNKLIDSEIEYQTLLMNGKHEEADKLYLSEKKLREEYELKSKRLESMKHMNDKKVIIDPWIEIKDIANSLENDYRIEHEEYLIDYLETRIELENKRRKLNEISNEHVRYNYALKVEASGHLHDIGEKNMLLGLVNREIFPDFYINNKLAEYRAKKLN